MEKIDVLNDLKKSVSINILFSVCLILFAVALTQFVLFDNLVKTDFSSLTFPLLLVWVCGFCFFCLLMIIVMWLLIDDLMLFLKKYSQVDNLLFEERVKQLIKKNKGGIDV